MNMGVIRDGRFAPSETPPPWAEAVFEPPGIVDGMLHGGIAQGVGQAMQERAVYSDGGQLLSGSMLDYAVPTAEDLPMFETDRTVTPSPSNDLGVKGAGEAGTIAATPAIVNAAVDALKHLGVRHIDMPLHSEKMWRIIICPTTRCCPKFCALRCRLTCGSKSSPFVKL
jgi:hypothetical protein